jgi:hypothetical protein
MYDRWRREKEGGDREIFKRNEVVRMKNEARRDRKLFLRG